MVFAGNVASALETNEAKFGQLFVLSGQWLTDSRGFDGHELLWPPTSNYEAKGFVSRATQRTRSSVWNAKNVTREDDNERRKL